VANDEEWITDIEHATKGCKVDFPIIGDESREIALQLGMLNNAHKNAAGIPLPARGVYIIGPDKKLKLQLLYPATTGRNFDEILRVLDSLQLTHYYEVATPANWRDGEACYVLPSVPAASLSSKFPKGVKVISIPSKRPYLKATPVPTHEVDKAAGY